MNQSMMPAFETKRLRVFKVSLEPNSYSAEKDVYLGFLRADGWFAPVVVATVDPPFNEIDAWVEWIETVSAHRREGLAAELVWGIEKHCGYELEMSGATDEGEAFCDYMERFQLAGKDAPR